MSRAFWNACGAARWAAAVSALDTTGYVGRVELEEALRQQLWKEYRGLSHFVPREAKALVSFPVRLAELQDIMSALRRLKSSGQAKPLPASRYDRVESRVDRKALAACTDYDGLLAAAEGSIYYAPLLHIRSGAAGALPDYTTAEALLRSTYFSHMYRLIHKHTSGETQRVLLRSFGEQIDLLNIIHILRLKTYFPGDDQYFSALFPFNYRPAAGNRQGPVRRARRRRRPGAPAGHALCRGRRRGAAPPAWRTGTAGTSISSTSGSW